MVEREIINSLKEIGLSQKESETYISLLESGQSNVSSISKRTGINRVTTYGILNSLMKKGVVISTNKDKIQNYIAISPRRLLALLKNREKRISSIIPELESISGNVDKKSSVSLYEGKKGIIELLQDVLDNAKTVYVYGNREIAEKSIQFESLNFRKERLRRKIKLVGLSNLLENYIATDKSWQKYSELRILNELKDLSTWTFIYSGKVAILTFKKELTGIIIENEEVANLHKFHFDLLWKRAKKVI